MNKFNNGTVCRNFLVSEKTFILSKEAPPGLLMLCVDIFFPCESLIDSHERPQVYSPVLPSLDRFPSTVLGCAIQYLYMKILYQWYQRKCEENSRYRDHSVNPIFLSCLHKLGSFTEVLFRFKKSLAQWDSLHLKTFFSLRVAHMKNF